MENNAVLFFSWLSWDLDEVTKWKFEKWSILMVDSIQWKFIYFLAKQPIIFNKNSTGQRLVGGFKYFLFSPLPGKMIQFD